MYLRVNGGNQEVKTNEPRDTNIMRIGMYSIARKNEIFFTVRITDQKSKTLRNYCNIYNYYARTYTDNPDYEMLLILYYVNLEDIYLKSKQLE